MRHTGRHSPNTTSRSHNSETCPRSSRRSQARSNSSRCGVSSPILASWCRNEGPGGSWQVIWRDRRYSMAPDAATEPNHIGGNGENDPRGGGCSAATAPWDNDTWRVVYCSVSSAQVIPCPLAMTDPLTPPRPRFSIVLPVYNEAGTIPELYRRLSDVLDGIGASWELVFVDDGSRDDSWRLLDVLHQRDPRVTVIKFTRNFGHHIAMTAGLDKAEGDVVVMMDSDLQDRPEEIPRLYQKLVDDDHDMVVAVRRNKKFGPIKRLNSALFHWVMRKVFSSEFRGGVFRIMRRKVVLEVRRCREAERLLVGLIDWTGFDTGELDVEHAERFAGETKYSFLKQIQLSLNSITAFTTIPLKIASWMGVFISLLAFGAAGWYAFRKLVWNLGVPGWASLMVAVFFIGGVQLLSLGVLGEYVGRIFNATRNRPLYVVDRHLRD